ncbi:Nuclear distribution protein nudF 1 [Hondaea fermentalgiana]|uniref:Nuclear distribution protein nudF 1 n=1 Tax=Hondaea fermentalgiana TaxID=2315210 RepID=A0A2R5GCA8_9STRA|nr:Nuclear distribution protein nudF 1 [Hondaea fermentalgiana]|eukprot:GBG27358.1 Nuclear distribution protein nudF 1 [Hondaea fermentalgiana]
MIAALDPRSLRLWRGAQESRRLVFPGGKSEFLSAVLLVPEKGVVVAAAADLAFKLYELHTLEYIASIALNQRAVYELRFLASTQELVSAGVDGVTIWQWKERKTEVWDAQSKLWKSVTVHDLHARAVLEDSAWARKMEIDEALRRIYVLHDESVSVYDLLTGAKKRVLRDLHKQPVTCCISYESSHYLVTGSAGGEICVWSDARDDALVHTFRGHSKAITALCRHPTPHETGLLVTSSMDGTISVIGLERLQERYRLNVGHGEGVSSLEVLANQHLVVTIGCKMELWKLQHMTVPFAPERAPVQSLRSVTELGQVLVHTADGSIRLVDEGTGESCCRVVPNSKQDAVEQVVLDAAQQQLFVLLTSSKILVYDASQDPARLVALWQHIKPHKDEIRVIALSPLYLIGGSTRGSIFFWDLRAGGELVHRIEHAHEAPVRHLLWIPRHMDGGKGVRYGGSTSTDLLISVGADADEGAVCIWSIVRKNEEGLGDCGGNLREELLDVVSLLAWAPVSCVAASVEQPLAFLGLDSGESVFVDLTEAALLPFVSQDHAHEGRVTTALFIDPLRLLVTVGEDGKLKVWDEHKKLVRMLDLHGDPVFALTVLDRGLGDLLIGEKNEVVRIAAQDALPSRYNALRLELRELMQDAKDHALMGQDAKGNQEDDNVGLDSVSIGQRQELYDLLQDCSASVASELFEMTREETDLARIADLYAETAVKSTPTRNSIRFARRLASIQENFEARDGPPLDPASLDLAAMENELAMALSRAGSELGREFLAAAARKRGFVSTRAHAMERLAAARDLAATVVPNAGENACAPELFGPAVLQETEAKLAAVRAALGEQQVCGTTIGVSLDAQANGNCSQGVALIEMIDPTTGLLRFFDVFDLVVVVFEKR